MGLLLVACPGALANFLYIICSSFLDRRESQIVLLRTCSEQA